MKVVADDDHIAHRHAAGEEQRPDVVNQVRIPDHQIGGNQAAAEIHRDDEKDAEELAPWQVLLRQRIGGDIEQRHGKDRANDGVFDGVHVPGKDIGVREDGGIAPQGKLAGKEEGFPRVHVVGIGHGRHQYIVEGIGDNQEYNGGNDHQNHVAGLVGEAGKLLFAVH